MMSIVVAVLAIVVTVMVVYLNIYIPQLKEDIQSLSGRCRSLERDVTHLQNQLNRIYLWDLCKAVGYDFKYTIDEYYSLYTITIKCSYTGS